MTLHPTDLKRLGDTELLIEWNDGQRRRYRVGELRDQCPCATCRERRAAGKPKDTTGLPILTLQEAAPLRITSMKPVGSYAYSIQFSDGHNTGIFTFELLRSLGSEASGDDAASTQLGKGDLA